MLKLAEIIGNLHNTQLSKSCIIHKVALEWYEVYKRIGRYQSDGGIEVAICFSKPLVYGLNEGDILYLNELVAITVEIIPCWSLAITTKESLEVAKLCYEVGNGHIPLFYENQHIFLTPYEKTLEKSLNKMGFNTKKELKKLHAKNRFYISLPLQKEPTLKLSPQLQIVQKPMDL